MSGDSEINLERVGIEEAAHILTLKRRTLERWVKRGAPTWKEGRNRYFNLRELDAWRRREGLTGQPHRPHDIDKEALAASAPSVSAGIGPIDVAGLPSAQAGGTNVSVRNQLLRVKLAKTATEAKRSLLAFEREQGLYVAREDVERMWVQRIEACKRGLLSLAGRCAGRCEGLPAEGIESVIREEVYSLLEDFSRRGQDGT